MSSGLLRRVGLAPIALSMVVLLSLPAVSLADTELGHKGLVGQHALRDASDRPGVTCYYRDSGRLGAFRVRPPLVRARNVTANVDHQNVAWQFIIQRSAQPGAGWQKFYVSPMQLAVAYDNQAAAFTAMSATPSLPASDDEFLTEYRVVVKMFWRRGGAVEGTARHLVDWYRWRGVDTETFGPDAACGAWWVIF